MSDMFFNASDQSCMNRFMTEANWDPQALNQARIEFMQQFEDTRFHKDGVIAIDDTIIPKTGKFIKDVGKLYDHANQRYVYGHDLLFIDYVHPISGKHYPLDFRRYKKEEQCEWTKEDFKKLPCLAMDLIQQCHDQNIPDTFAFDNFYSTVAVLNFINSLKNADGTSRRYVGDVKFNRKINFHVTFVN